MVPEQVTPARRHAAADAQTLADAALASLITTRGGNAVFAYDEEVVMPIAAEFPFPKQRIEVLGRTMAYVEAGAKLLIVAEPGAILNGAPLEFCRHWPNQHEVSVAGNHFLQEDSPDEIGGAIALWIRQRDEPAAS